MNKEIQDAFTDGIYEVYSIMFTDGIADGIKLYLLDEETTKVNFYRESKVKRYKPSKLLVAKAEPTMKERGDDDYPEDDYKDYPKFTVPYKSLRDNNIPCQTEADFRMLRKAYIEFHSAFYEVLEVGARTFIEDVYEFIVFNCVYRPDITEMILTVDGVIEEETAVIKSEETEVETKANTLYGSMSKFAVKETVLSHNKEKTTETANSLKSAETDNLSYSEAEEVNLDSLESFNFKEKDSIHSESSEITYVEDYIEG